MDSLTQATLGALCGEVTLRKELGWRAAAWGALIGTLPDLDIIAYPWLTQMERLAWHRGISHSVLLMFISAIVLGFLLFLLHRKRGVTLAKASMFVFLTWSTHVLIDCFTTYGTQVYEPFARTRVSFNNMSIVDLLFTVPMLLALLIGFFMAVNSKRRRWLGYLTVTWLVLYTGLSFVVKNVAEERFSKRLATEGITPLRMSTSPTLGSILMWRMVAETENDFHITYWSVFDDEGRQDSIEILPKNRHLLEKYHSSDKEDAIGTIAWFANDWHRIVPDAENPDGCYIVDLRYPALHTGKQRKPMFVWHLAKNENALEVKQMRFRNRNKGFWKVLADFSNTLGYLRQRTFGGAPDWMDAPRPWKTKKSKRP